MSSAEGALGALVTTAEGAPPRVVVVGAGFGGLAAARSLARAGVDVTVVDRTNHHLFQPLLYQVATAGLSPADIAHPVRSILRGHRNARVLLAEATGVDLEGRRLLLDEGHVCYDSLVIAVGSRTSYFGHPEWARDALGLKTIPDALRMRHRILLAFEKAEREPDPAERERLLTFVVIGGGPTGVELAGALGELSRRVLARDFRAIDPSAARIVLLEAGDRLLTALPAELSEAAVRQLGELGVEVRTGVPVTAVDGRGVAVGDERIDAGTVLWAAGVRGTGFAERAGLPVDAAGRVPVEPDCSVADAPEVFCIGDAAALSDADGRRLPAIAPVAMQQGRFVARTILGDLAGRPRGRFRYVDRGQMATVGRSRAVAAVRTLEVAGLTAWIAWLALHLWYLMGFRNRLVVFLTWAWSYVTWGRGARLIAGGDDGSEVG